MKYTIEGFYQPKLVEFKLDPIDATILRWFVDFIPKMSKIEFDGKTYHWVNYQSVIDDLPCLGINSKDTLARRFNKFVDAGIMDKLVQRVGGVFIGFRLLPRYLELVEYPTQKSEGGDLKVGTHPTQKSEQNNPSIINQSIKSNNKDVDKSTSKKSIKVDDDYQEVFDYYGELSGYETKQDKTIVANLKKILKEHSVSDVKLVIEWILQEQWYIDNGQTGLSVISRPTKFFDKLERAEQWQRLQEIDAAAQKAQVRILKDGSVQLNVCGEWMNTPQITIEMACESYNVVHDGREVNHD